jgi:site-specific recombinase XerD
MSSNVLNYQAILEHTFIDFLLKEGASLSTRNNYRTDVRHFLSWVKITIQKINSQVPDQLDPFFRHTTPELLENYKRSLLTNDIPVATINRRLCAIRMFFRCCHQQGFIDRNPAVTLQNVIPQRSIRDVIDDLVASFRADLAAEGASKVTVRNYCSDVRQFITWLGKEKQIDSPAA